MEGRQHLLRALANLIGLHSTVWKLLESLFVTDPAANSIFEISPSGVVSTFATSYQHNRSRSMIWPSILTAIYL